MHFSQANKAGKTHKVPLTTFYVEEISRNVDPFVDVSYWWKFSQVKVTTPRTVFNVLQHFRGAIYPLLNSFEFLFFLLLFHMNLMILIIFLKDETNKPAIFCCYPFLFTLECKAALFKIFTTLTMVPYAVNIDNL